MVEQIKLKHLENTFLKLTETNQFFILGLVEGLKNAQGNTNGKLLIKKDVIKFIECEKNNVC